MNKLLSLFFMITACAVIGISITGCTYHKHYYGQGKMLDEGVVVQEKYVVE